MYAGSDSWRRLPVRLDVLEVELEALDALRPRNYGESRTLATQKRALKASIAEVRNYMLALGRWDQPGPNWGDGKLACAGCATSEALYSPGLIRWSQPVEEPPPPDVVLQSADADTLCGAFVVCEACVPGCCRCFRPRPRPLLRTALASAAAGSSDCAILWSVVPCADDHLDDYATTVIKGSDGTIYAGPGAGALPSSPPAFVVTAWNPGSEDTHPRAKRLGEPGAGDFSGRGRRASDACRGGGLGWIVAGGELHGDGDHPS